MTSTRATILSTAARPRTRGRPFAAGYDPRRHVLTRAERQRGGRAGFLAALRRHEGIHGWLVVRIRCGRCARAKA